MYVCMYVCSRMNVCVYVCMYVCMFSYARVYVCICMSSYACMYYVCSRMNVCKWWANIHLALAMRPQPKKYGMSVTRQASIRYTSILSSLLGGLSGPTYNDSACGKFCLQ
jgi:hypothetical protein